MYIARNADDELWVYSGYPTKDKENGIWHCSLLEEECMYIPNKKLYPEIKWEDNEPHELILKQ